MKTKVNSKKTKKILPALLSLAMILGLPFVPMGANAGIPPMFGPRGNVCDDPANGIYVSPAGNDAAADGSADRPYRSINAALEAAEPGDTVILRGGTYREGINVRVRKPNITIKSKKGEWAVIDLSAHEPGHDEDSGVYFDVDSSGGRLQCVEVIGGYYAVCMETKWNWGGDDDFVAASNIAIEDCKLHDSKYDVVKVKPNCDNITIRYNEIYNSGRAELDSPGWLDGEVNAEGIDNVNGDNMKVHNNHIHDIGGNGIYAKGGATDALIENNFVERICGAGIMVGFDTYPEFFDTTANPQYYENIRGIVRGNLIVDTGWEGIGLYASKDAQVYNNTLIDVDNGPGKYHSAIYFGLSYQAWEPYAGRPANVNPEIHHNIVCQPASFDRPMVEIRYSDDLGGMPALEGNPKMSENCYYIAGKSAYFNDFRPRREIENARLSAWQSHIGGDSDSIEADPGLDESYMPTNPLCAGMGAPISGSSPVGRGISNFVQRREYAPGQFADVDENMWYGFNGQLTIARAYMYGLMEGENASKFDPTGNMTIAQAVTVAARARNIYEGGDGEFAPSVPWYRAYADYAVESGIMRQGDFADLEKLVTRAEMAYIFANALPREEYPALNTVNSLPDVDGATKYREEIVVLYESGVLAGSDDVGTFRPGAQITRAEAAAIISRAILPPTRISGKTFG